MTLRRKDAQHSNARVQTLPLVSVVMPVRNEAAFIAHSLEAVLAQDYPASCLEVIIADGLSMDGTREVVRSFQARHPNLVLIDNHGMIAPTGLNSALRHARGEIIVRVDGHCEIAPDYVRRCVEHLKRGPAQVVGGSLETIGETSLARVIAIAMSSQFGVGGSAFRTVKGKTLFTDTVPFPAYTREVIDRIGPFDEELVRNQDDEYNYRLRKMGEKVLLASDVHSRYHSRSSIRSLWRQYFQYGYWKVRVMQKHPRQMRARQFIPFCLVASLFIVLILAIFGPTGKWLFGLVAGSYLIANFSASVAAARRCPRRLLPMLSVTFAILHFSYGFGFLTGLLKFRNRWRHRANYASQPEPRMRGAKQG